MNKNTWDILTKVLDQKPEDRKAKLTELCKGNESLIFELTQLIEDDDSVDSWWKTNSRFNEELLFDVSQELKTQFPTTEEIIGQSFGPYTIVRSIAEGGMGKVFRAERSDGAFDRIVAIKIMSFNLNTTVIKEHFFREQKMLASLNYSGIAQLYDAEVSENGTPYLVMEFVDGVDLISFAKQNDLSLTERIELFIKVSEAVDFAHRNLIVHRDLKPSNILITKDGQPKILDFGVSSWLQEISTKELIEVSAFTLKYSSPEQIKGHGTSTSTDIYSLGILLFELLAETHPFDFSQVERKEAQKTAIEKELPLLSEKTDDSKITGDLDAIVKKTTQKKEERRYQTVQNLIQDLKSFQNHFPVTARKSGSIEKGMKFWKRNPASTTMAIIIGVGILLFSTFYNIQINKERIAAEREAQKAIVTKDYLLDLFASADPLNTPREKQTVEDFLEKSITDLSGLDDELEVKEEATYTLAQVSFNLGAYFQAESLFVESYNINKNLNPEATLEQANALDKIGIIYVQLADYKEAKTYFDLALTTKRELLDANSDGIASSYSMIGGALAHLGNLDSAEVLFEKSMAIYSSNNKLEPEYLIRNIESVADLSREKKDFERSARLLEENILLRKKYLQEDKRGLALSYNNLGFSYRTLRNYEKAEEAYKSSLLILEEVFGEAHPNTLTILSNLAGIYSLSENLALAEKTLSIRLERVKKAFGESHWRVGQAYAGLGGFFYGTDQFQKSVENFKSSIEVYEMTLGKNHFWTNRAKLNAAISEVLLGRNSEGKESFKMALNEIKKNIESRLTYYNYSSLEHMQESLKKHDGQLSELSNALSDFIEWHNSMFPS